MALHSSLTGTNAHKAYAWSYATAAARTGASGFAASDIGDLAYQEDTDTLWILTATTPTWQQVDYRALADMYQANAILAADTAQTPASLQIAEQRVIGRITGGSITGLTAAQILTLIGVESGADVTDATNVNAAGAVMESDYQANAILAANDAQTPLSLQIAEDRVIGRITGGTITGLTATQVRTLLNVENGATADMSASEILTALLTVDGTGCLLDADLLDGVEGASYVRIDSAGTITAIHTLNPGSLGSALTLGSNAEAFYKSADTGRFCVSGNTDLLGSAILLHGKSHATLAGLTVHRFGGGSGIGSLLFQHYDGSVSNNLGGIDPNGNLTLGNNAWPSTGTRTISVRSGTAPSSMTDYAQIYSADITAGNCAIHCRTENGSVIKLFQGAAVADATDATSVIARLNDLLARMRANGLIAT